MKNPPTSATPVVAPVSTFVGPIETLIRNETLEPPTRPGNLAVLEGFELLRLIGAGGMGLVFLARDTRRERKVAIKLLHPALSVQPSASHRFLVEARHLRRLEHAHILPILEVVERKRGSFFVMPYFEMGSLAHLLRPGQPLQKDVILRISKQIATALEHAHNRGIIHRDLKPANILLDNKGNAFLSDFGLARTVFNDSFTDAARPHCEGTAPYMSPAVAAGHAEDTRCDIYGFGAVLYEMLTGHAPYSGSTTAEVLEQVKRSQPRPIFELNASAPSDLVRVAMDAMARQLRDRYTSMGDIVADLGRIEEQQMPLGAHGQWKAPLRWPSLLRRHALAGAGAAVLLIAAVYVGLWYQPKIVAMEVIKNRAIASWKLARIGDWDNDKAPDIFLTRGQTCAVFSTGGVLEDEIRPHGPISNLLAVSLIDDANADDKADVFLSWADGRESHLACYNRLKFSLFHFSVPDEGIVHAHHGRLHTDLSALRFVNLGHDGKRALLVRCITGWSSARGLYCVDATTGVVSWFIRTSPNVTDAAILDVNGDGKNDVIFGSAAVANDVSSENGTDDGHSYLYAVSSDGTVLWRVEMGDTFSRCYPLVVYSQQGRPRLYAYVSGPAAARAAVEKDEFGFIVELDENGHEIGRYNLDAELRGCIAEDYNRDGVTEFLATDGHGFLHVLDASLQLQAKREITPNRFNWVQLSLVGVTHLTASSERHLVFSSSQIEWLSGNNLGNNLTNVIVENYHRNTIQVWSESLRKIAEYQLSEKEKTGPPGVVQVVDWDGDGIQEIVSFGREMRVMRLQKKF